MKKIIDVLLSLKPDRETRAAAMSLTAAAGGFVVFLLSLPGTVYLHLHCRVFINLIQSSFKGV